MAGGTTASGPSSRVAGAPRRPIARSATEGPKRVISAAGAPKAAGARRIGARTPICGGSGRAGDRRVRLSWRRADTPLTHRATFRSHAFAGQLAGLLHPAPSHCQQECQCASDFPQPNRRQTHERHSPEAFRRNRNRDFRARRADSSHHGWRSPTPRSSGTSGSGTAVMVSLPPKSLSNAGTRFLY